MKKIKIVVLACLVLLSCTQEDSSTNSSKNFSTIIKNEGDDLMNKNIVENILSTKSTKRKTSLQNYYLTQDELNSILQQTGLSEEIKNSVTLESVNLTINELLKINESGNTIETFDNLNLSVETKSTIVKLIDDGKVQNVSNLISLESLNTNEKETLLVVNDITNDAFSYNYLSKDRCFVSSPSGSGFMDCRTTFMVVGAAFGGSFGGVGGAVVGGIVGYLVGSLIEK